MAERLAAVVDGLRSQVDGLRAELSRKDGALIWQKDRIEVLEKALGDSGVEP